MKRIENIISKIAVFIMLSVYVLFGKLIFNAVKTADNPMDFILPFFVIYTFVGIATVIYYVYSLFTT